MNNASFSELDITSIKEKLVHKKYDIKHIVKNNNRIEKLILQDGRNGRQLSGKLATRLHEGESYVWPCLHHRSLERLLDIVKVNSRATVYITLYTETNLRDLIHQEVFLKSPVCYLRKKNYIEDVLWGLEYLHANSLCLLNLCDSNVLICEKPNRAVISDFSKLSMVEKATKQAFSVPPLHRAPELLSSSLEKFQPKAAEMWTAGVMILEIILQHRIPWTSVDYNPSRVMEIVDDLDLPVLQTANPESQLSTRDLEELKRLANWLFCPDPSNRCSAMSAAGSEFVQSSRTIMNPRSSLPPRRELPVRSKMNERLSSCANEEFPKISPHAGSQWSCDGSRINSYGKCNQHVNRNYGPVLAKSTSLDRNLPKKQQTFLFDSHSCNSSLINGFKTQRGNLQKNPNPCSEEASQGRKRSRIDSGFALETENSQEEIHGENSTPSANSIDPSEIVHLPFFRESFESYTKEKRENLDEKNVESETPVDSANEHSLDPNASSVDKNQSIQKTQSCSLIPCCGDHTSPIQQENSDQSNSYYVCSSGNLSSYLSENSLDMISLVLSIKRRLEFIDSMLFGKGNFLGISNGECERRQKSKEPNVGGDKEAKSPVLYNSDAVVSDSFITKTFDKAGHHLEPITPINDLQSCCEHHQEHVNIQKITTKTPAQREIVEEKTVNRQSKFKKKGKRIYEEMKCEARIESTQTQGGTVDYKSTSKGSDRNLPLTKDLSHSKGSSMNKIQEALLCKRQYSYQKAVWGKGKITAEISPPNPETLSENQAKKRHPKKYTLGKGIIEVEIGSQKNGTDLTAKGESKKVQNTGDGNTHHSKVPLEGSVLRRSKDKKKRHGCFCWV